MSTVESLTTLNPFGREDECAKMVVDAEAQEFILVNLMRVAQEYTLSFWLKSDAPGTIISNQHAFPATTEWQRYEATFVADTTYLTLRFQEVGTYYIYHAQLEIGNRATDWVEAPEDVSGLVNDAHSAANSANASADDLKNRLDEAVATIEVLKGALLSYVVGPNGETLLKQTDTGWEYSFGGSTQSALDEIRQGLSDLTTATGDAQTAIKTLSDSTDEKFRVYNDRIKFETYVPEDGDPNDPEPCIRFYELTKDGEVNYSVIITNKRVLFQEGSMIPVDISEGTLNVENIRIKEKGKLKHGQFAWVDRSSGSIQRLGLVWEGA